MSGKLGSPAAYTEVPEQVVPRDGLLVFTVGDDYPGDENVASKDDMLLVDPQAKVGNEDLAVLKIGQDDVPGTINIEDGGTLFVPLGYSFDPDIELAEYGPGEQPVVVGKIIAAIRPLLP